MLQFLNMAQLYKVRLNIALAEAVWFAANGQAINHQLVVSSSILRLTLQHPNSTGNVSIYECCMNINELKAGCSGLIDEQMAAALCVAAPCVHVSNVGVSTSRGAIVLLRWFSTFTRFQKKKESWKNRAPVFECCCTVCLVGSISASSARDHYISHVEEEHSGSLLPSWESQLHSDNVNNEP